MQRENIKGFAYDLSLSRCGEDYNPGMGFEMREDYLRFGNKIKYGWIPGEKSRLQNHNIFFEGFVFRRNEDKSVETTEIGPGWEFTTKNGYVARISLKYHYENVDEGFSFDEDDEEVEEDPDIPVGRYKFYSLEGMLMTAMGRRFSIIANTYAGSFYDGWRLSQGITPRWNVSPSLELSGTYQLDLIKFSERNKHFYSHIGRLRIQVMFSTKLTASAFIQYNSNADTIISNARIRYNPSEGNDLYIVYNEGRNTYRFREVPVLPTTSDRTIMIKYTYTFKL